MLCSKLFKVNNNIYAYLTLQAPEVILDSTFYVQPTHQSNDIVLQ